MRTSFLVLPFLLAACASQEERRATAAEHTAAAPAVEFRSAFEGYRPFAEQDLRDWRRANDEVGTAGGHGHRSGAHEGHK